MYETEGRIPFHGHETWYRAVGETAPGRLPLLCLHGGPGAPHDYLTPLAGLAETGRQVVFYDQIGCGNSAGPAGDPSLWTVELFREEVGAVRDALGLAETHLFGSSWGGMLAMEYALTRPAGLASLTLASSPASIPLWAEETARLRSELPEDVRRVLDEHEAAGTTQSPEYVEATMAFYRRHVCRTDPWPDYVRSTLDRLFEEVYLTMQGPNEFVITGTLSDWDVTDRLPEIDVPTLVTSGRYDEATPRIAQAVHHGIPGSEWALFEHSSHMAFVEETERYLEVLDDFLSRVESARA
ncbi:MAG TPA: proline iminopeptidase-family hydrolase [Gaiellaceae bacterium]|nr:proline iminopeptidase-family hydrolase [Gaiellaceae bacterium]